MNKLSVTPLICFKDLDKIELIKGSSFEKIWNYLLFYIVCDIPFK
jgi:hypothetical protein